MEWWHITIETFLGKKKTGLKHLIASTLYVGRYLYKNILKTIHYQEIVLNQIIINNICIYDYSSFLFKQMYSASFWY